MRIVVLLLLLITPAFAQQAQTPSEQALSSKLLAEINAGLQCSATLLTERAELQKAHARIKELEDKYEPKSK